jgi:hypothetical protein
MLVEVVLLLRTGPFELEDTEDVPLGATFTIDPGLIIVKLKGPSCISLGVTGDEGVRATRPLFDGI